MADADSGGVDEQTRSKSNSRNLFRSGLPSTAMRPSCALCAATRSVAQLKRGVISVAGRDAEKFLQGLISANIERLRADDCSSLLYAALLNGPVRTWLQSQC